MAGTLGVFMFGYVYINYMIKPANKKVAELTEKLEAKQSEVKKMKRQARRLPALKREYEGLVTKVGETEKKIPKEDKFDEILRTVTEETLRYRIELKKFSPSSPANRRFYKEIPVALDLSASFHTLGHLLSEIGQQERILCASNLSLNASRSKDKGGIHTINARLNLLAYVFID